MLINLFNFRAALAGDNVRTGVASDLKAVYGRAEEFFVNTYDNFPKKNDAQTNFFQYLPQKLSSVPRASVRVRANLPLAL